MTISIIRHIFIFVGVVFSSLILAQDDNSIVDQVELIIYTDQSSFTLFFSNEQLTADEIASLEDLSFQYIVLEDQFTSPTPLANFPNFAGINLSELSDTICLRIENTERGETPTPLACRQPGVRLEVEFVTSVDSFWYDTDHNIHRPIIISNAYTDQACPATDRACDITYNITEVAPPQTDVVRVIVDYAISRSGPNTDYPIIENVRLVAGDELELTGQYVDALMNQQWLKGRLPDDEEEFWIFAGNVESNPSDSNNPSPPIPVVTEDDIPPPPIPPDRDDDGVPDIRDHCPDLAGIVDLQGCPDVDEDEDGVPDAFDACPMEGDSGYGINRRGCPLSPPPPDMDGDGIGDEGDICPDEGDEGYGVDAEGCSNPMPLECEVAPLNPNGANIRSGPAVCYPRIDVLADEETARVMSYTPSHDPDDSARWWQLETGNWVSEIAVSEAGSCDVPVVTVPIICTSPDSDGDGIRDSLDNCPHISNPDQLDNDRDEVGDVCDNCVSQSNPEQLDSNVDGIGDDCSVEYISPYTPQEAISTVTPQPIACEWQEIDSCDDDQGQTPAICHFCTFYFGCDGERLPNCQTVQCEGELLQQCLDTP